MIPPDRPGPGGGAGRGLRLPRGNPLAFSAVPLPAASQPPDRLFSVGGLARRAGLTPRAVRHYDRVGLLRPHTIDESGYRWYSAAQVDAARHVARLRRLDVPLEDVRRYLTDPATLAAALAVQQRRLQARLARTQRQLHDLAHLRADGMEHAMPATDPKLSGEEHRRIGIALFNATWTLIEKENRSRDEDDAMLHMAHASRHHWAASGTDAAHLARGEWQCSRVYAILGRPEPSLHHAQRVLDLCQEHGIGDFDLAFAYEALARGHAIAGNTEQARACTQQALAAAEDIAEDDERELVLGDLETIPGQKRFW
jgi:DNA-binding transcriptional MerR regulator